jgi:hypothetical protein
MSDIANSLMNQRNYGPIIKKYQSKKTKVIIPSELQKYNQYMTYQRSILDELNYVAEKLKNEDLKKKSDDYEYIEKIKSQREDIMKTRSKVEEQDLIESLFDPPIIKIKDYTPTVKTNLEDEILDVDDLKKEYKEAVKKGDILDDEAAVVKIQKITRGRKDRLEVADIKKGREVFKKASNASNLIGAVIKRKSLSDDFQKVKNAADKISNVLKGKISTTEFEKLKDATLKIGSAIKGKISNTDFQKVKDAVVRIQKITRGSNTREQLRIANIDKDFEDKLSLATTVDERKIIEDEMIAKRKRGRPAGSKNKPKVPKP